jgi:hypothetical protein
MAGGVAPVLECLCSKYKALSSNPSTTKNPKLKLRTKQKTTTQASAWHTEAWGLTLSTAKTKQNKNSPQEALSQTPNTSNLQA